MLYNEISKELQSSSSIASFESVSLLNIESVNAEVLDEAKDYLATLNQHYISIYNKHYDVKDKLITSKNRTEENKQTFITLKDNYTNDALTDLVTDKNEFNKILEKDGHLYQKANPVYLESESFRSHFFAPSKQLFGRKISTFWANIIVLWTMSFILAITLNFDVLRKLIEMLEAGFAALGPSKKR